MNCPFHSPIPDIKKGDFLPLLDTALYYTGPSSPSPRHRIHNNLPGTKNFCPLIRRTSQLDTFIAQDLTHLLGKNIEHVHPDVVLRASAFLLLADSKASYAIEGEHPTHNRAERWGYILGKAGQSPLSHTLLHALQSDVIPDSRFITMGYRKLGGFIGRHDRNTQRPIPEHISARSEDIPLLMEGLIQTNNYLKKSDYPPVLLATIIAFGFVFIHPFEDGNGRIHRYLIHHILAEAGITAYGIPFPISSVILEKISTYRQVLEAYSRPRLPLIEWRETAQGNVDVLHDTAYLYRYFDATTQAEFLYSCLMETITTTLPKEVHYLQKHDLMKAFITQYLDMPDPKIDLLIQFLYQNNGQLSQHARKKYFAKLTHAEAKALEEKFDTVFGKILK